MKNLIAHLIMGAAAAALTVLAAPAHADYPKRPIRLVVPFAPGGVADGTARFIASELSNAMGQSVVVDNRPGGATIIATHAVVNAAPDGYTLLLGSTNISTNSALHKKLSYDVDKDLTPVALAVTHPGVIVTHPSVPAKTFTELLTFAQRNPGKISYATVGQGSFSHLAVESLVQKTQVDIVHVPYKGYAPAIAALLAGESHLLISDPQGALPYLQANRINALAVTGAKRLPVLPGVPTVQESGVKDYEATAWLGILAPAGTPEAIVAKLNAEINRAMSKPSIAKRYADQGMETHSVDTAEFRRFLAQNKAGWAAIIKAGNISMD